jgi:hypothetical protein
MRLQKMSIWQSTSTSIVEGSLGWCGIYSWGSTTCPQGIVSQTWTSQKTTLVWPRPAAESGFWSSLICTWEFSNRNLASPKADNPVIPELGKERWGYKVRKYLWHCWKDSTFIPDVLAARTSCNNVVDLKEVKPPTSSECISQYAKIGLLYLYDCWENSSSKWW